MDLKEADVLMGKVDYRHDRFWVVKDFFNSVYDQDRFLWALPLILSRRGCVVNEEYCLFPDLESGDPSQHFTGVLVGSMEYEVNIFAEEFSCFLLDACARYLKLHPEHEDVIARFAAISQGNRDA